MLVKLYEYGQGEILEGIRWIRNFMALKAYLRMNLTDAFYLMLNFENNLAPEKSTMKSEKYD